MLFSSGILSTCMKSIQEKKRRRRVANVIKALNKIEENGKESDPLVVNWVQEVLLDERLKLISGITDSIFDICSTKEIIQSSIYYVKLLLRIDSASTIEQLKKVQDFEIRLISYIKAPSTEDICEDVFYILKVILLKRKKNLKEYFTFTVIQNLLCMIDRVVYEENLISLVEILIEINSWYFEDEKNVFLVVLRVHDKGRVFMEVLIKLLNIEKKKKKILKILFCFSRIVQREKCRILYYHDMENFVDIVLNRLQFFYSEEVKLFIIDSVEKLLLTEYYYQEGSYRIEELKDIFEDYANKEDESQAILVRSKNILTLIHSSAINNVHN